MVNDCLSFCYFSRLYCAIFIYHSFFFMPPFKFSILFYLFSIYYHFETKKTSHLHRTFLYLYRFYFKINLFYHKNVYNVQHLPQEIFLMYDLKYVFVTFSFCNYWNANVKNNCYDATISYNSEI